MDANANELALGDRARATTPVEIPLTGFTGLNYLSKYQILATRAHHVNKNTELLLKPSVPTDDVFGQIEDSKPWWGTNGAFVFGSGSRAIEGPAEESRFLLNPFLLVGLSPFSAEIWDTQRITDADLARPDFPYCWLPKVLRWHPKEKVVQVLYDVSAFNQALEYWQPKIKDREPTTEFGLVAYNARDFGYNFIYVPTNECENIINDNDPKRPVRVVQFIHLGDSAGYPGGCNNMSPAQKEIDHLKFKQLPASLKVNLYKQDPGSASRQADLTVLIELR